MQSIITIFELLAIWLLTFVMGLSFTKLLLPRDIEKDFGAYIAPTVGYLVFCLIAFTISSTFKLSVIPVCWGTAIALLIAGSATQLKPAWRITSELGSQLKHCLILILPMTLIILSPLLYFGAKTYLGAVNPDFFAGVVDNYYLLHGLSVADFTSGVDTFFPIDYIAGTVSSSARFGAGIFAILVQLLSGEDTRTALSLIIGFFLLSMPLIVYFFSSVVLGFNRRQATIAGWLIGLSGPVSMSYLYYYLGQNSGLPALPLVMTSAYIMLMRPSIKTLLFCGLLSNALFVNYFAMLPYALASAGVLGLYLMATRRLSIVHALALVVGFLLVFVALHLGDVAGLVSSMQAWGNVIGQTLQGQFFLDFLTELFLPLIFGVIEYPIYNSWIGQVFRDSTMVYVTLTLTGFIFVFWLWSIISWIRNTKEMERKIFIIASFLIYLTVWWIYSFPRQYAYAIFKMSSWLQFIIVPFIAYGFWQLTQNFKNNKFKKTFFVNVLPIAGYIVGFSYVVLNFATSMEYAHNGFGRNTATGYIINNFEMSGNNDYFDLKKIAKKYVKPNESVELLFVDSIQNFWVSYYLHDFRQSIPLHEIMPGDDENLPDIKTNSVMDYYGNLRQAENPLAHDFNDEYILTWNKEHINQDIVSTNIVGTPIWENHTFRLFDGRKIHDLLVTGRGFYRLEYLRSNKSYWLPKIIRWSARGGEFYLLRVKNPGKPYRLVFDALVGYETPKDSRTLELWLNGKKFQTLTITHTARVVSDPFYPKAGKNKLVVYIEEKNNALARRVALWNNDIPSDYRRLNIAFANAHIVSLDKPQVVEAMPQGRPVDFLELFNLAKQFDGLQLDGWIGDEASATLAVLPQVKQMQFKGFIPEGFNFPYQLTFKVNGVLFNKVIPMPGYFTFDFPVNGQSGEIKIALKSSQSIAATDVNIRHKHITRSIKIESIEFV